MWDVPSHDCVDKLSVLSVFWIERDGLYVSDHARKLTGATCLFLMCVIEISTLCDRLAVGDTRFATRDNDSIFTTHSFDIYLEMKFAHTGDNGLARR